MVGRGRRKGGVSIMLVYGDRRLSRSSHEPERYLECALAGVLA